MRRPLSLPHHHRRSSTTSVAAMLVLALAAAPGAAEDESPPPEEPPPVTVLDLDREWEVLPEPTQSDYRPTLKAAAEHFQGGLAIEIAGVVVDETLLSDLAETPADVHLLARARDRMGRAVDLLDFCFFLDDVIVVQAHQRGEVVLTPSRARGIGVLLHPDEVFRGRARDYGQFAQVPVEPPLEAEWEPPADGASLGPSWHARFPNPEEEEAQLAALALARPDSDFADRVRALVDQLRLQGADVFLESTLRQRERGYLMYGAFWLSKAKNRRQVKARARALEKLERRWKLNVDIEWKHEQGWRQTREEARRMVEAYNVVYATRSGAMRSNHYDGAAVDLVATNLPRELVLVAPDGEIGFFDLRDPEASLDLSLTPEVIEWVDEHFRLEKLPSDYPHWDDADR